MELHDRIHEYQAKLRRRQLRHKILSVLAGVVVFCTTYALILPALTMEQETICGQEEHVHVAECYQDHSTLICNRMEVPAHTHTESCYQLEQRLICETPESVGHSHSESCYDEDGELICGQEESLGHVHTDDCYETEQVLVCGLEETEGHVHTEDCYQVDHDLVCGLEEHTHTAACYPQEESPSGDPNADVETQSDWEASFRDVELTGDWSRDVLAIAESQLGYTESTANFIVDEEGGTKGYTRYGAWYGDPYGDWCAMFASFCLHYAQVEDIPLEANCGRWIEDLSKEEYQLYHPAGDYVPQPGDLVFFDMNRNGSSDHIGFVVEMIEATETEPAKIKTLEGNSSDRVQYVTYNLPEDRIIGFGQLPEEPQEPEETPIPTETPPAETEPVETPPSETEPSETEPVETPPSETEPSETEPAEPETPGRVYAYTDETLDVSVTLGVDSAVPEDATLAVRPITGAAALSADGGDDYDYEELVRQAEEAVDGTAAEIVLYDISFYTLDGTYLPVENSATVSMRFKEPVLSEGESSVTVLHYAENAPVALEEIQVQRDENAALTELTFTTEGFSVFAVVTVTGGEYQQVTKVDNLDGKSVAILSVNAKYAMRLEDNSSGNGRKAEEVQSTTDLDAYTIWKFEKNTDGTYYISSGGSYLVMGAGTLKTTTSKDQATAFNVTIVNGRASMSASVNGTDYYINLYGGEVFSNEGFRSYDSSNYQRLYIKSEETQEGIPFTGLGGKSFVIANLNTAARQYAMSSTHVTNDTCLDATKVSVVKTGATTYVTGDDLTTWTFEATSTPGVYHIQADDTKKYLSLTSGALTTSDTPTPITVTTGSGTHSGQVRLSVNNTAVDWHGGSNAGNLVFGPYAGSNQNNYQTLCEVEKGKLLYDLNFPIIYGSTILWQTTPTIESVYQDITENTTLYDQPTNYSKETGTAGIENLYRFNVVQVDDILQSPAYLSGRMKDTWYGEQRFDGWTYTADDGITYLLDVNSPVTIDDAGNATVTATRKITTDQDGNTMIEDLSEQVNLILPEDGATLKGHWTEVSNVVTFFVNYKGTILDTEGDVTGRRTDTFTKAVAVGHVFYGKLTVGNDQKFGAQANAKITSNFAAAFDPNNPDTQIVIEYLRECTAPFHGNIANPDEGPQEGTNYTTSMQMDAHGVNNTAVTAQTLKLLKETGRTIQVATGQDTNPVIDNSLCDENHYEVRWYVMKEQNDAWHIDGVLVAKTSEISIAKTFSGISTEQAQGLLNSGFYIDTQLGTGDGVQDYLTITKESVPGQYTYHGSEVTAGLPNSYHWTLNAITDEAYTLTEQNYALDGYDVSSIIVHYYTHQLQGDKIVHEEATSTSAFDDPVIGGATTAISFNNFYTPKNTGAMAIVKRDSTTGPTDTFGMLQDAEFTLYTDENCKTIAQDKNGKPLVVTSNANGTAYFSGMTEGTYYLKETQAPQGYELNNGIWRIRVANTAGKVTVMLDEKNTDGTWTETIKLYDGGIQSSYIVKDDANSTTITVSKTFEDLPNDELTKLIANSKATLVDNNGLPSGYYIQLQGDGDVEGKTSTILTLEQAQAHQNNTFVWTIHDLAVARTVANGAGTTTQPIQYTISEHNYMLDAYVDVVVTARATSLDSTENAIVPEVKDQTEAQTTGPYLYIERGKTSAKTVAYIKGMAFSTEHSDIVQLNNRYTNTFDLKLRKIDSVTDVPLADAEFKIYGPYEDIPAGTPTEPYTYVDENGQSKTVYYLKTITSEKDGYAVLPDLRLSQGENTFVYVLDESKAPDGYAAAKPQVVTVVVNGSVITTPDGSNYLGGVLQYKAPNTKEQDYVHEALNTTKVWEPSAPANATVTLELYRVTHTRRNEPLPTVENAERVAYITLDGKPDAAATETGGDDETDKQAYVTESAPWVATWGNLYSAPKEYGENGSYDHYHYFVREVTTSGYDTEYTCIDAKGVKPDGAIQKLQVKDENGNVTETFNAVLLADMDEAYTVTITNTAHYELPETGGRGRMPYAVSGALMMAAVLASEYMLRRRRERRNAQ